MKSLLIIVSILFAGNIFAQGSTGDVLGEVKDKNTNEPIYYAIVTINDNGTKYQARTDEDGRFRISGIPSGKYLLHIISFEDTMSNIAVNVPIDGYDNLGVIAFEKAESQSFGPVIVTTDRLKLEYGSLPAPSMDAKEIEHFPGKFDQKNIVTAMSSEIRQTEDGDLVIRGARKGDMIYMMDGIKSNEISNVPSCAIGRITVYTGGLPAKYGDTLGGAVVMETKSYFDLYREWEAEQILSGKR